MKAVGILFLALFLTPSVFPAVRSEGFSKEKILRLVNEIRKKGCNCGGTAYGPAPALSWNDQLEKAATAHSNDMFRKKFLGHNSSTGKTPGERIRQAGYAWTRYGENVAVGYDDENAVIVGWLSSPQHCANLMNPLFKEMGVAQKGKYWTQDFGTR